MLFVSGSRLLSAISAMTIHYIFPTDARGDDCQSVLLQMMSISSIVFVFLCTYNYFSVEVKIVLQ